MKFLVVVFLLFLGVESVLAESKCDNGNSIQSMNEVIDDEFLDKYENIHKFAHIYCRENLNCHRANSVKRGDLPGGDPDTGKRVLGVLEVECTDDKKFRGLFKMLARNTVSSLSPIQQAFNELKHSGKLPQLAHDGGRDFTEPMSIDPASTEENMTVYPRFDRSVQ